MDENLSLLVIKTQLGDKQALNKLLAEIEQPLYGFIMRLTRSHADTPDILQEVLITIFNKIKWLNKPKAFKTWAYKIALRQTLKHCRKKRLLRLDDLSSIHMDNDFPEPENSIPVLSEDLKRYVDELSPASKIVIEMHYFHGFKLQQIADVLDLQIGTVKSRLHYGLSQLKQKVNENKE